MADSLPAPRTDVVGLLLAAGAGTRLRPLTLERPKPLVPVGNRTLLDWADGRLAPLVAERVVNVHHGREALLAALDGRAGGVLTDDGAVEAWDTGDLLAEVGPGRLVVSVEDREALGTAGAVGRLRPWLDGRAVLVVNTDSWCAAPIDDPRPLAALLDGWDGERIRVLVHGADRLGPGVGVIASLLPAPVAERLAAVPSGLWEVCWRDALAEGRLESIRYRGTFLDTGTPASYLAANLFAADLLAADGLGTDASGTSGASTEGAAEVGMPGASLVASDADVAPDGDDGTRRLRHSVVGSGARVEGTLTRTVVWSGAEVAAGEWLVDAVRTDGGRTVLVR